MERTNPQTNRPYSLRDVASVVGKSHSWLRSVLNDEATDLRASEIRSLAEFFGVDISYFSPDLTAPAEDAEVAAALRRPGVRTVTMRTAGANLSPAGVEAVLSIIDQIAALEAAQRETPTTRRRSPGGQPGSGR
jgi:transcriptional regulator with XRE-family HTH domain